jgi:hypothetical protein
MPGSIVQTVHLLSIWQSNFQAAQKDYVLVALLMEAPLPQFMAIGIFARRSSSPARIKGIGPMLNIPSLNLEREFKWIISM